MATELPVISDGIQQSMLDIVSIPGLPALHPQYKTKDHTPWLREVLSHQVPYARIMTFQYDFAKDTSKESSHSWNELRKQSETLLEGLTLRRGVDIDRPILFICYSFGSVILKHAINSAKDISFYRNIFDKTGGIIFIGCPSDDSHPQFSDVCLKCAAVEFGTKPRHEVVESLRRCDIKIVEDVLQKFQRLRCHFPVRVIYELKDTPTREGYLRLKKTESLCDRDISRLGWDDEELIGVDRDHTGLTMYPSRDSRDDCFEKLMKAILELAHNIAPSRMPCPKDYDSWSMINGVARSMTNLTSGSYGADFATSSVLSLNAPISAQSTRGRIPCYIMTPYEINPDFVGRADALADIGSQLSPTADNMGRQRTYALVGLGGMGKTQTALSYAFNTQEEVYSIILWADADNQSKLADSFILFARELGLGDGLTPVKAKQVVIEFLEVVETDWLLIFDNADGPDNIKLFNEFWPGKSHRGSILITSRDFSLKGQYGGSELHEIDPESAIALLLNLCNKTELDASIEAEERLAATEIVKRLGYLPLGINNAASIVLHDVCSLVEFLDSYSCTTDIIEDHSRIGIAGSSIYQYSLGTVWEMNFERLSPDQRTFIKILSFLDPDRIHISTLRDGVSKLGGHGAGGGLNVIDTPRRLKNAKSALLKSTLVSQSTDGKELRMHRLVQAECQRRMDNIDEARTLFKEAYRLIRAVWPIPDRSQIHNPSLWETQRALLAHVMRLCGLYVSSCEHDAPLVSYDVVDWEFASMLYEAGWFCYESGLLHSVSELLLPAEKYCLQNLEKGGGYRLLADIYGGLGSLYTESNRFEDVYRDFSKQWKYLQLAFEHGEVQRPNILEVFGLGRMGNAFLGLHKYQEAEEYYRRCLKAWEGLKGDRKIFKTHLATCLWLQGRQDEGEEILKGVIKDINDTTNFRTAMAMYSLGNIQIAQARVLTQNGQKESADGKFNEAMAIHVKVLQLWTITLGERHHKTADAMYKVGWHLHGRKEYKQALEYFNRALDIYTEHTDLFRNEIARTRYKMGCVLQDEGGFDKGRPCIEEAERIRREIVPAEEWAPATGEGDFDEIVQFWTR